MEVWEMREVMAEREAKKHRGPKFWAGVLCLPVIGVVLGVMSTFVIPSGSPNGQNAATFAAVKAAPEAQPAEAAYVDANPGISPQDEMRKYEATLRKIKGCSYAAGSERTSIAKRGYIARNRSALARLNQVVETSKQRSERLAETRNERYSSRTQVAVGMMTGQLQNEIMGDIGSFESIALGISGDSGDTKSDCKNLFAEVSKGTFDINFH